MKNRRKNPILAELFDERIFSIELSSDKTTVTLMEECDNNFSIEMNKDKFGELLSELQDIYDKMVDE